MKKHAIYLSFVLCLITIRPVVAQQLLGPATGLGVIYEISHDGRYVVGLTKASGGNGFVWDSQSGNTVEVFDKAVYPYCVTNDKLIAGNFNDVINGDTLTNAGYFEPGASAWTSLGTGLLTNPTGSLDGASARRITPDGRIITGYSRKITEEDKIYVPYCWRKNEAGEWTGEEWAHPENAVQGYITDISDDGQTATGFIHTGMERKAALWRSPQTYELPVYPNTYSEYLCISGNGKYAGFSYDNGVSGSTAGMHNLETGEIIPIPEGFRVNAISNNGYAVGIYRLDNLDRGFIWSKKLGFMDFGDFFSLYIKGIDLSQATPLQTAFENKSRSFSVNAMTPDGLSFAVFVQTDGSSGNVYVLKIKPFTVYSRPKNLAASVPAVDRNTVILTWEAPEADESETLTGYRIYRNNTLLATTGSETLTYTELNVAPGYHIYSVQGVYGEEYSNQSNAAQAVIVRDYYLPLRENFDKLNLSYNYWATEIVGGETRVSWNVYDNVGVDGTGLCLAVNNFYGLSDQHFSGTLISKYLDGSRANRVYLSFLVKPDYYLEKELTADTLLIDVYDGTEWKPVDKYVFSPSMEWKADLVDLSEAAAGKLFRVRFRVTGVNRTISTKYLFFDDMVVAVSPPAGNAVPSGLLSENEGDSTRLAWKNPHTGLYALTYARSNKRYSIGNAGKDLIAVNRFSAEDLHIYQGKYLTSVTAYINRKKTDPSVSARLKLAVYLDDARVSDRELTGFTLNAWNTFPLDNPVLLNGEQELKFGIELLDHDAEDEPIGVDGTRKPVSGKGDLYSEDGGQTWKTMTDAGLVNNWCIIGNVADNGEASERPASDIVGYNVYSDGVRLNNDLIFGQHFASDATGEFTVRAYSLATGISAPAKASGNSIPELVRPADVSVYPNPVRDLLFIRSDEPVESLSVYDLTGRRCKQAGYGTAALFVGDLSSGIYLVKVKTSAGFRLFSVHRL
jgi:hypothetical protein